MMKKKVIQMKQKGNSGEELRATRSSRLTHGDERPLEVQQLRFGLSEVPEVAAQLKHPEHQHQRTVLTRKHTRHRRVTQSHYGPYF